MDNRRSATTAPRTTARLTSFLYRAAADLSAAAINARNDIDAHHAWRGRELCTAMFVDLAADSRRGAKSAPTLDALL